jgi:hypothetical protein
VFCRDPAGRVSEERKESSTHRCGVVNGRNGVGILTTLWKFCWSRCLDRNRNKDASIGKIKGQIEANERSKKPKYCPIILCVPFFNNAQFIVISLAFISTTACSTENEANLDNKAGLKYLNLDKTMKALPTSNQEVIQLYLEKLKKQNFTVYSIETYKAYKQYYLDFDPPSYITFVYVVSSDGYRKTFVIGVDRQNRFRAYSMHSCWIPQSEISGISGNFRCAGSIITLPRYNTSMIRSDLCRKIIEINISAARRNVVEHAKDQYGEFFSESLYFKLGEYPVALIQSQIGMSGCAE